MRTQSELRHYPDLDGMRGVLACLVMLMHFGINHFVEVISRGYVSGGEWGLSVDFFFVLSGFVLCRSFIARKITLSSYIIGRIGRLAPMYILALLMVNLTSGYQNISVLISNILMIQSFLGVKSMNFPSWSIPFELFLPAIFVVIMPRLLGRGRLALSLIFLLFFASGIWATYNLVSGFDHRPVRAVAGLGVGFMLYLGAQKFDLNWRPSGFAPPSLLVLIAGLMATSSITPITTLFFYPVTAVAVLAGSGVRSVLAARPFQFLGKLSYSIYLLHIPILACTSAILGRAAVDQNPALKIALVCLTLLLSWVSFNMVEKPFALYRQRRIYLNHA